MAVALQPSGHMSVRVSAAMMALVLVSLIARSLAKLKTRGKFLLEDWLLIGAALFFYGDQGTFLYAILGKNASGGSNILMMTFPQIDRFLKYLFVEEILFVLGITLVKLSILSFYRHIFSVKNFVRLTWILFATCVVWAVITIFIVIFQCSPVRAFWTYELLIEGKATCINSERIIFGFEISNVVIDLFILSLPVYMVQRLQLKTAKKFSIIGIFLLGGFVCVTCAVRAYYIYDPKTKAARNLPAALDWTTVEVASAIVCASLPTYGPFLSKGFIPATIKSWYTSLLGSFGGSQQRSKVTEQKYGGSLTPKSNNSQYDQLTETADATQSHYAKVVGGPYSRENAARSQSQDGSEYHQMNNIRVQRSVEVV